MSDLTEQSIIDLLNGKRLVALENCKNTLQNHQDDPSAVVYDLNDQDGFLDLYKNLLSDDEIERAMDSFGQMPFTDKIGDLEMNIWIEAANELGFTKVAEELARIKKEGV